MNTPAATFQQVEAQWAKVTAAVSQAKIDDDAECTAARGFASNNVTCPDIDGLMRYKDQWTAELDALVAKVDAKIQGLRVKDVTKELKQKSQDWYALKRELKSIRSDVKQHLGLESWQGKGAEKYKQLLPTQIGALKESIGLAHSQAQACNQLSVVNGAMFDAIRGSLRDVVTVITDLASASVTINHSAETIAGRDYMDAYYLTRTNTSTNALQSFLSWLGEQEKFESADWKHTARTLDDDLVALRNETVMLQPHGKWPHIGLVVNGEPARTGGAGRGKDIDIDDADVESGDRYVDLN